MAKMMYGSIDLNKIEKSKIITTDKNGNNFESGAKYLNVVVWVNEQNDQYGNIASIQQSITKEEREQGVKANYIGNLKHYEAQQQTPLDNMNNKNGVSNKDDLPF